MRLRGQTIHGRRTGVVLLDLLPCPAVDSLCGYGSLDSSDRLNRHSRTFIHEVQAGGWPEVAYRLVPVGGSFFLPQPPPAEPRVRGRWLPRNTITPDTPFNSQLVKPAAPSSINGASNIHLNPKGVCLCFDNVLHHRAAVFTSLMGAMSDCPAIDQPPAFICFSIRTRKADHGINTNLSSFRTGLIHTGAGQHGSTLQVKALSSAKACGGPAPVLFHNKAREIWLR